MTPPEVPSGSESDDQSAAGARPEEALFRFRLLPYPRMFVLVVLVFASGVFLAVTLDDRVRGLVYLVAAIAQAVPWVWLFVRGRRYPWAVRIGMDGVTWSDTSTHMPWSEVAELRVVRPRRVIPPLWPPGVRLISRAEADFAARASSRPAGNLIDASQADATPDEVLAAIARYVRVPIINE